MLSYNLVRNKIRSVLVIFILLAVVGCATTSKSFSVISPLDGKPIADALILVSDGRKIAVNKSKVVLLKADDLGRVSARVSSVAVVFAGKIGVLPYMYVGHEDEIVLSQHYKDFFISPRGAMELGLDEIDDERLKKEWMDYIQWLEDVGYFNKANGN